VGRRDRTTSVSGSEREGSWDHCVTGDPCSARDGFWLGDLVGVAGFAVHFLADHLIGDVIQV
jgi:hypothetical protein